MTGRRNESKGGKGEACDEHCSKKEEEKGFISNSACREAVRTKGPGGSIAEKEMIQVGLIVPTLQGGGGGGGGW